MKPKSIFENDQAMSHPRPILWPNLHVAELDHWLPLCLDTLIWLPIKAKEVNLE